MSITPVSGRRDTYDVVVYGRKRGDGRRPPRFTRRVIGYRNAQGVEAEFRSKRDKGRRIGPTSRLSDYSLEWLDTREPEVERQTHHNYAATLKRYVVPYIGDLKVSEIGPPDVRGLMRTLSKAGLADSTRRYAFRVLSMIMKQAVQDDLRDTNPCAATKPPKDSRPEPSALERDDIGVLLEGLEGTSVLVPALIAYDTGMRRAELIALTWDDLDLKEGVVTVRRAAEQVGRQARVKEPKSRRSRRQLKLSEPAVAALREHRAQQRALRARYPTVWSNQGLVFPSLTYHGPGELMGRLWTPNAFSHAWRKGLAQANERRLGEFVVAGGRVEDFEPWEFGVHRLRHTFATHTLEAGVRDEVVSRAMGHSSSSVTRSVYSHLLDGEQAETAKVTGQVLQRRRV